MGQLIVLVAMFALLWLILIRPAAKRKLAQQQLLSSVEVGDEILTAGGLYGHVRSIGEDDALEVEIAPGTSVRMARRAVAAVIPPDDEPLELDAGEVDDEPDAVPTDENRR
ncbi:MAG TPA: preprotein translocase subunit YajC [Gaiellaceae bacterium]|nr:preprotein translocase subunit YajC [Gaiellaceae bacterium]